MLNDVMSDLFCMVEFPLSRRTRKLEGGRFHPKDGVEEEFFLGLKGE